MKGGVIDILLQSGAIGGQARFFRKLLKGQGDGFPSATGVYSGG